MRLGFHYNSYKEFITKPFYYTDATVITSYEKIKHKRRYKVLKLRSDEGFTFYTTSHRKENFNNQRLRLQIFPNKSISFYDYLVVIFLHLIGMGELLDSAVLWIFSLPTQSTIELLSRYVYSIVTFLHGKQEDILHDVQSGIFIYGLSLHPCLEGHRILNRVRR